MPNASREPEKRIPTVETRPCCARATTGHAAALPSPAMNCRRRISHASEPICAQPIAHRAVWERVASLRGANFLRSLWSAGAGLQMYLLDHLVGDGEHIR